MIKQTLLSFLFTFLNTASAQECMKFQDLTSLKITPKSSNLTIQLNNNKSHAAFVSIAKKLTNLYAPEIKELGMIYQTRVNWGSENPNASAFKWQNEWSVNINGALYRDPNITNDAYALVICHEIGHLIGGAPFYSLHQGTQGNTIEGQADFWGASVCAKKYFSQYSDPLYNPSINAQKICNQRTGFSSLEKTVCMRTIDAGYSLALFFEEKPSNKKISILASDKSIVSSTDRKHPMPQCRLDTYKMGALCEVENIKSAKETLASRNLEDINCKISENGNFENVRPTCWFNKDLNYFSLSTIQKVKAKNTWGKLIVSFSGHEDTTYSLKLKFDQDVSDLLEIQTDNYTKKYNKSATDEMMIFNFKTKKRITSPINAIVEVYKDGIFLQTYKTLITD